MFAGPDWQNDERIGPRGSKYVRRAEPGYWRYSWPVVGEGQSSGVVCFAFCGVSEIRGKACVEERRIRIGPAFARANGRGDKQFEAGQHADWIARQTKDKALTLHARI